MAAILRAKIQHLLAYLPIFLGLVGCASTDAPQSPWTQYFGPELQAMGYRNWVVVADAAFPMHSRRGVRTLMVDGEIPEVLNGVLEAVEGVQNVTPRIYLTREMRHVPNDRAPGMDEFRRNLEKALHGYPTRELESRSLSLLMEDSADTFSVLVLKTRTALPYSSVFIELENAYWDVDSEKEMRARMMEESTPIPLKP